MFFGVMLEIGIVMSVIGAMCTGVGKIPMIKRMHENNKRMKEQKKLEKKEQKKKKR